MLRPLLLLLVLLLSPVWAWGVITLDLITTAGTSPEFGDKSFNHTVAADANFLLVCTSTTQGTNNEVITSITYATQPLTFLVAVQDAAVVRRTELWYRFAPAAGNNLVAVNAADDPWFMYTAISLKGVDQTTPTHVNSVGTTSATPSLTVTSAVGEYVIDCLTTNSDSSIGAVPGSSPVQTERVDTQRNNVSQSLSTADGAATSVTMDWTLNASYPLAYAAVSLVPTVVTAPVGGRRFVIFP